MTARGLDVPQTRRREMTAFQGLRRGREENGVWQWFGVTSDSGEDWSVSGNSDTAPDKV